MSFTPNPIIFNEDGSLVGVQVAFFSGYNALSDRYKKDLNKGWAGFFRRLIMPFINEEPYRVLYSDKPSPQNTPVNVLLGAIILKAMQQCKDDDDIRYRAAFDMEYRYALCCENLDKAPFSDNMLTAFRRACIDYYIESGVDLIYNTFVSLKDQFAKLMEIDSTLFCIDSTMIETWAKDMSRLELIYVCNEIIIQAITGYTIHKRSPKTTTVKPSDEAYEGQISFSGIDDDHDGTAELRQFEDRRLQLLAQAKEILPEKLHRYLVAETKNITTYHSETPYQDRVKAVLSDASDLLLFCEQHPEHKELQEYQTFARIIGEQCKTDPDTGELVFKKKGDGMNSNIAQSPYDLDATYREKDGKVYKGYSAVFSQAKNADGETLVMDYQVETNNVSDEELGSKLLDRMPSGSPDGKISVTADSLFSGPEIETIAEAKNIEIINTNITGKKPEEHCADHEFDSNGVLTKCAGGAVPVFATVNKQGVSTAKFIKAYCGECPHREKCNFKELEDYNKLTISVKTKQRAEHLRERETLDFKAASDFRNGVETVPSILKNVYHVDENRSMGLAAQKLNVGIDLIATNFKKVLQFLTRREKCALT